ncbi:YpiF family protein [Virgibacillus senegalensis]|uniref:YpiF family protein n=1 Tax=Virgibacillus senegalensis TaxID=1499679 RepID=UPI00069D1C0C|nr:YpiF family protein [Virgibacillus senegalensis]
MQWNKQDVGQYFTAEEYIDTLLVPLMPVTFTNQQEMKKSAAQLETATIFVKEMEKEFKGRIFLMPSYHYMASQDLSEEVSRLNDWTEKASERPFRHIFYFSFDPHWKKQERNLNGNLLWLPAIQSEDIQSKETQTILKNQINQLTDLIKTYW